MERGSERRAARRDARALIGGLGAGLLVVACSSHPAEQAREASVDVTSNRDVSPPVDRMVVPDASADGGLPASATACTGDYDCVYSIEKPIVSIEDCLGCRSCPTTAINRASDAQWKADRDARCEVVRPIQNCPLVACEPSPPVKCISGRCTAGSIDQPTQCPAGACEGGGVMCQGVCCRPGEWCDPLIGMCRCGQDVGCPAPDTCEGAAAADACGTDCFATSCGEVMYGGCVATEYDRPVLGPADCYCPQCRAHPLNQMSADLFARQWAEHCSSLPAFTAECPLALCRIVVARCGLDHRCQ